MNKAIILMMCLFLSQNTYGYSNYYKGNKRGWFWFEKRQTMQDRELGNEINNNQNPVAKLKAFQEKIEEAKAAMIMAPSVENTRKYIELQNSMFTKADEVARNWQAALLMYPDVNIAKNIPTSQAGINIARKAEKQEKQALITEFAKKYKLLFFYKAKCPYCEPFGDVIELFSRKYGFKVASVTLDGSIKKFPAGRNPDLVSKLKVDSVPALFAFSESEGVIMPLSTGYVTVDILERNTKLLIKAMSKK